MTSQTDADMPELNLPPKPPMSLSGLNVAQNSQGGLDRSSNAGEGNFVQRLRKNHKFKSNLGLMKQADSSEL